MPILSILSPVPPMGQKPLDLGLILPPTPSGGAAPLHIGRSRALPAKESGQGWEAVGPAGVVALWSPGGSSCKGGAVGDGGGGLQHPFSMWVSPWHLQVFFLYFLPQIQCHKRNQEICEKVAKLWHFFICYENKGTESRRPETELHLMRLRNSSKTAK